MSRQLTTAQFKKKLYDARGDSVILLSEYSGSTKPIEVKFMPCGHERTINKPYNLLYGKTGCPICAKKDAGMSATDFKKKIYALVGNEYTVASVYKNMRTKVNIIHNVCGYKDWWVRPDQFLQGSRCPKCASNVPRNTEKYKQEVYNMYGDEYTVLGKYKDRKTPVKIRHNTCGFEWSPTPGNFLGGRSHCPDCRKRKLRKLRQLSQEEVLSRINRIFNGTLKILNIEDYQNTKTVLDYHCTVCGANRSAQVSNLLSGHGCSNCANKHRNDNSRLSTKKVAERIDKLSNGTYKYVSGEYHNNTSPLVIKHLACDNEITTNWLHFSQGAISCKYCKSSFPEQQIQGYLNKRGISYQYGYIIPDLKDKRNLHFDFWFPKQRIAIEYDGQQHFRPADFAGRGKAWAEEKFKNTQRRDRMKNAYCKEKHIKLIRISYTDDLNKVLDIQLLPIIDNYD